MQRILLLLFLLVLAVWVANRSLRRFLQSPLGRQLEAVYRMLNGPAATGPVESRRAKARPDATELRKCDVCGSYVPSERGMSDASSFRCEKCKQRAAH